MNNREREREIMYRREREAERGRTNTYTAKRERYNEIVGIKMRHYPVLWLMRAASPFEVRNLVILEDDDTFSLAARSRLARAATRTVMQRCAEKYALPAIQMRIVVTCNYLCATIVLHCSYPCPGTSNSYSPPTQMVPCDRSLVLALRRELLLLLSLSISF